MPVPVTEDMTLLLGTTDFLDCGLAEAGVPFTDASSVEVGVFLAGHVDQRTWLPASTLNGAVGLLYTATTLGLFKVHARVSDVPETPIIDCGSFYVAAE